MVKQAGSDGLFCLHAQYVSSIIILILICFNLAVSCSTPPEAVEPVADADTEQQRDLEEAKALIRSASPGELRRAAELLLAQGLNRSRDGEELFYLCRRLSVEVYPLLSTDLLVPGVPEESDYPQLFERALSGQFPTLEEDRVSFLSLMVSSLSLLSLPTVFAGDAPVPPGFPRSAATVKQLRGLDSSSLLVLYLSGRIEEQEGELQQALETYSTVLDGDKSFYPATRAMARILFARGQYLESSQLYRQLSDRFPEQELFRLRSVEALLPAGETGEADLLLSDLIQRYPDDALFVGKRPLILEQYGRFEQAERLASVLERSYGETADILLVKARLLLRRDRSEEAVALLKSGQERYGDDPFFRAMYEQTLIESGNIETAQELLRRSQSGQSSVLAVEALLQKAAESDRWEEAEGYLQRLVQEQGEKAKYLRQGVEIYRALSSYGEALSYARKLLEIEDSRPLDSLLLIDLLIDRSGDGDLREARALIQNLLESDPGSSIKSSLYYQRSRLARDREEELELLRSSLLENLENVEALLAISKIYREQGDYKKAYRYLSQAVLLEPNRPGVQRDLEEIEMRLGGDSGARGFLTERERLSDR